MAASDPTTNVADASHLPTRIPSRSALYFHSASDQTESKIQALVRQFSDELAVSSCGVSCVTSTEIQLRQILLACASGLSAEDRNRTRCCLVADDAEPTIADYLQSVLLEELVNWVDSMWLADLLTNGRMSTHFQPILPAKAPDIVFAYECLSRGIGENGELIVPYRMFSAAKATGLLKPLDQLSRITAIRSAAGLNPGTRVFVNFSPKSLSDPKLGMESTLRAILDSEIPPEHFVFEVVESDKIDDVNELLYILDAYRELGARVALDDLGSGYSSLNLLAQIKPDFIKLDMNFVRNIHRDKYKSCIGGSLLQLARELRVLTVVEGVETAGEFEWAQKNGADYVQGYLFDRPKPIHDLTTIARNATALIGS